MRIFYDNFLFEYFAINILQKGPLNMQMIILRFPSNELISLDIIHTCPSIKQ